MLAISLRGDAIQRQWSLRILALERLSLQISPKVDQRTKGKRDRVRRKMDCMKYLIAVLALAGMFVSIRALQVHRMDPTAAPPCAVSEHWDCGAVGHSRYSVFPARTPDEDPNSGKIHIPVAAIGIAGYVLIAIVALTGRMWIVLELARVGFFCAAFLSYIEAYVIQMWCIYCVWSQAIIAAILLASVVAVVLQRRRRAASIVAVLSEQVD
jgi:vitamin-K-epoxide reductase (warfarin-sensitive)